MREEYKVTIALSSGREITAMATLTKEEAETLYFMLQQPREQRTYEAMKMGKLLIQTPRTSKIRVFTSLRGEPGLSALCEDRSISWSAAYVYVSAVSSGNEPGLLVFQDDLSRIRRGVAENGSMLKPFLPTEGFNKKVTDK